MTRLAIPPRNPVGWERVDDRTIRCVTHGIRDRHGEKRNCVITTTARLTTDGLVYDQHIEEAG